MFQGKKSKIMLEKGVYTYIHIGKRKGGISKNKFGQSPTERDTVREINGGKSLVHRILFSRVEAFVERNI